MTTNPHRQTVHAARNCIALAAVLILSLPAFNGWAQTTTATASQPSQKPLITRDGGQPSPNVMLTLDTSWSMIFPYLPEGEFTVNGYPVKFPGFNSPIMHPADTRYTKTTGNTPARTDGNGGVIPADLTDKLSVFQRQMRSPDVNKLYYNPRQLYQPWLKSKDVSKGTEVRYDPAMPSKAWFDPTKTTDSPIYYANLTAAASEVTAVWCPTNPTNAGGNLSCSEKKRSFSPAVYFLLKEKADPTVADSYAIYDLNNPPKSFTKYPNRTDCKGSNGEAACTPAQELQNYANWFVYYRTRLHTAEAAIPEAFLQLDNNKIRVGWGTIHQASNDVDGKNNTIVQSGVREFDSTRKGELVTWIRNFRGSEDPNLPSDGKPELAPRTPLIGALTGVGQYFEAPKDGSTWNRSPWVTNPAFTNGDSSVPLACRRAYNVLITDGYYTDTSSETNQDNEKGLVITNNAAKPKPATYTYEPSKPFFDDRSGTLADVAMKYWKTDLQPNIPNKLPHGNDTPLEDPAFWQHLVQFPIGLGVEGNIPLNDLTNQLKALTAGTKNWWGGDANKAKVDDLLHAAVNSRGQYFSAKNSSELVDALSTALSRTAEIPNIKEGGVSVTTTVLGNEATQNSYVNAKYVPEYTAGSWIGDVKAWALNFNGIVIGTQPKWIASEHLPAHGSRNIITWQKKAAVTPRGGEGIAFAGTMAAGDTTGLLTPTLPSGANVEEFINYIRGDTAKEDSKSAIGLFRQRTGKLPDFINSNPVLLKSNVNLGYEKLPEGTPGKGAYSTFVSVDKANRLPVLVVGGNGGMLHAFADYTATGVVPGQEVFAYVPRALLPKLSKLALRTYGKAGNEHSYYVDGPLAETDAYVNGNWKNILLGTLGAGGKGLYALDVTTPSAMGPSSILWERSSEDDADGDMGYMLSAPQAGILPNGDWAVFVGNGVHSSKGHAALLVINLSTGAMSKQVVDSTDGNGNGLGGVTLVRNTNQQVIGAYAGDLKGNVWRFNMSGTGKTTPTKLFQAQDQQPITAAPAVMVHPNGGYLVVVGTGKLYDEGDNDDQSKQSVYGLWDKTPTGESEFAADAPLAKLVKQSILQTVTDNGGIYYTLTANTVDFGKPNVLGWYIDLTIEPGQRLIYPATIIKNYVLIGTMAPAATATFCDDAKGHGYNYLVPVLTGGASEVQVLDTTGDGLVKPDDKLVSVYTTDADGGDSILTKEDDKGGTPCSIQSTGSSQGCYIPPPPCLDPTGCLTTNKITSRVWRQIFNPPTP